MDRQRDRQKETGRSSRPAGRQADVVDRQVLGLVDRHVDRQAGLVERQADRRVGRYSRQTDI